MNLELVVLPDSVVYLNYFDRLDGDTRVFELRPDGTAHEITYDDIAQPHYKLIDLVAELRAMALARKGEANP